MTREAFIRKWLANPQKQYNEQFRDEMRNDLDLVIKVALSQTDVVGRSEQFSFVDMKAAFDYGSNSGNRYDAMTFTEWISKR